MALPRSRGCIAKGRRLGRDPVVWLPVRLEGGVVFTKFGRRKAAAVFEMVLQKGNVIPSVS